MTTVRSFQKVPSSRSKDLAGWAVPYRIVALEKILKDQPLPAATAISIEPILLSWEEENKGLFPQFSLDLYYVHVQNRERSSAFLAYQSGASFGTALMRATRSILIPTLFFWATIDRLTSVTEFVASRL
jgi:hypothetical protein